MELHKAIIYQRKYIHPTKINLIKLYTTPDLCGDLDSFNSEHVLVGAPVVLRETGNSNEEI